MTKYDYILFGSSPLVIFHAAYLISKKYKIVIFDNKSSIGGAWSTISLKNFKNVENAIHYFLEYDSESDFLTKNLKLNIVKVKKKKIIENHKIYSYFNKSFYLKYGQVELENVVKKIIKKYKIKIIKNTQVEKIIINTKNNFVFIKVKNNKTKNNKLYFAKKILVTSGLKINNICYDHNKYLIYNRRLYRPTVHLVIDNIHESKYYGELIFKNSYLIKYVHDVTPYAKNKSLTLKKKKNLSILVIALRHHIKFNKGIYNKILKVLKKSLLNDRVKIIEHKWNDIFLPPIPIYELNRIKKKFSNFIEIMYTENFITTVKKYNKIWKDNISL
jgi:hypothetical protein